MVDGSESLLFSFVLENTSTTRYPVGPWLLVPLPPKGMVGLASAPASATRTTRTETAISPSRKRTVANPKFLVRRKVFRLRACS